MFTSSRVFVIHVSSLGKNSSGTGIDTLTVQYRYVHPNRVVVSVATPPSFPTERHTKEKGYFIFGGGPLRRAMGASASRPPNEPWYHALQDCLCLRVPAEPVPAPMLPPGTRVLLRGLHSAAHHNGKEGKVASFEPYSSRYLVHLKTEEATLSVRAENLMQSLGVEIVDLQGRPELNGKIGRIVGVSDGRYHVSVQGTVIAIAPANAVLPVGAQASVAGLVQDRQWNGRVGVVTAIDREAKRYVMQMDALHVIKVRWDSLML